jgi:2-amino-4-hydroxy-6-hydroxymethyldihydropteridine diphosphokinase
MKERIYLLLGSNQGDRLNLLQTAIRELERAFPDSNLQCSSVYETAAWGMEDQPSFLNQAIGFDAYVSPRELLSRVQEIELLLGRQRTLVWGPRSLDIDILFFGNEVIHLPDLEIPHPRISERRFALIPMAELAPEFRHPVLGPDMKQLLEQCEDPLPVHVFEPGPSIA